MSIIVGYTPTPEGKAALQHALREGRVHHDELVVVNVSGSSDPSEKTFASEAELAEVRNILAGSGLPFTVRQLVRGKDAAEEIVDLAQQSTARLVVIGVRHRTPVGKLILGSNSQRILLDAACPVLAVKAAH